MTTITELPLLAEMLDLVGSKMLEEFEALELEDAGYLKKTNGTWELTNRGFDVWWTHYKCKEN